MAGLMSRMTFDEFARSAARQDTPLVPVLPKTLPAQLGRDLEAIVKRDLQKRFLTGTTPGGQKWKSLTFRRPGGGSRPLLNRGDMMAAIRVKADGTGVVATISHPGAALQNFGGIVRPKKGKFLAIPLTREAVAAGSPRRMRGTGAAPLFARMVGGRWVGHFLLVKQVTVSAREFWGISRQAEQAVGMKVLDASIATWMAGRNA